MRTWFVVLLLFGFYGSADVFGIDPARCPNCVPQVIMRPRVVLTPYEFDRTEVVRREFRTPVRDWLVGRERVHHIYRPQVTR